VSALRNPFRRRFSPPAAVLAAAPLGRGEKVLAATPTADDIWLLGTRDALVLAPVTVPNAAQPRRVPWEQVERADWDRDEERLVVTEVGEYGVQRPRHVFSVAEPGLLLELVRERVTASVLLQRRVAVEGRSGLFVVARRAPAGHGPITWAYEFDPGVNPEDPTVMAAAEAGLRAAQGEVAR
jgi:hypothetical protein